MFEPFEIPEVKEYLTTLKGVRVELEYDIATHYYIFRMSSVHANITRTFKLDMSYHGIREGEEVTRHIIYCLKQLAMELGNDLVRLPRISNYTDYNRGYEYREPDIEALNKKYLAKKQDPINNDNAGIF
jgi:hypothetical protein